MKLNKFACVLFCAIGSCAFAQNVVVFGDSLSDVGQQGWNKKASYLNGSGVHRLYNEYVAKVLGSTLTASSQGGTNYAYSGGVVVPAHSQYSTAQPQLVLAKQVETYLTSEKIDQRALHILWSGGNDIATLLTTAAVSKKDPQQKQADVADSIQSIAQTIAQQWTALRKAGVNLLVVPTIPNVAYTPEFFDKLAELAATELESKLGGSANKEAIVTQFKSAVQEVANQAQQSHLTLAQQRTNVLEKTLAKLGISAESDQMRPIVANVIKRYQDFEIQAALATHFLNAGITSALNQVGGNLVRIDTDTLLQDMLNRPAEYGLNNILVAACAESTADRSKADCQPEDQKLAGQHLFADSFHPGPMAHKAMADYILNVLQAPQEIAVLTDVVQHQSHAALDFAREESHRHRLVAQKPQSVDAVVAYQKQHQGHSLRVGAKIQFNPHWQLALLVSEQKQQLQQGQTHIVNNAKILTTALRYDADKWWLGATLQANNSQLKTQRINWIGEALHRQSAEPKAQSLSMALFAGYEWQWQKLGVALIADVNKTKTQLSSFAVQEKGLMEMQFSQRTVSNVTTGVGFSLRYQGADWQPYVSTRFVKNWNKEPTVVNTRFNGSVFSTTLSPQDSAWLNVQAGLQWKPSNTGFYANIGVQQDFGRKTTLAKNALHFSIGLVF